MRKLLFVPCLVALLAVGCKHNPVDRLLGIKKHDNGQAQVSSLVKFEPLFSVAYANLHEPHEYIIHNQSEFEEFLYTAFAIPDAFVASSCSTPLIDFTKQTVVVVTLGDVMSSGYGIEVSDITDHKDAIHVTVKAVPLDPSMEYLEVIQQPTQIIVVDSVLDDSRVKFIRTTK